MSGGDELGVYETYEENFGRRAPFDELIRDISQFSMQSVIWVCAAVVTGMQLWKNDDSQNDIHKLLVHLFFSEKLASRLIFGYWCTNPQRQVFHRRQILLIVKVALMNCGHGGIDLRHAGDQFGLILLKANDQFHYGLIGGEHNSAHTKEDFARIAAEFIAVTEFSRPNIPYQAARNHLLLTRFTQSLRDDVDFVDASGELEQSTGLDLAEWETLVVGTHARFGEKLAHGIKTNPEALILTVKDYSKGALSSRKVGAFLKQIGGSPSRLRSEISVQDNGPNDFRAFRKYPMIEQWYCVGTNDQHVGYQLLDHNLLLEKQITGPYWHARNKNPDGFPRFWGRVFEAYINELLYLACAGTPARYIPDLRHSGKKNVQLCDGIVICQDSIVVIECKESLFKASAKYSGHPTVLADELDKKLIYENKSGKKKAALQLASAVSTLLNDRSLSESLNIDLDLIKRVYPLVVTLDNIGGTFGISPYLELSFGPALTEAAMNRDRVAPLLCIDSDGLEYMSQYFHSTTFPELLERWLEYSPTGAMPFVGVPDTGLRIRPNAWLKGELDGLFRSIADVLFPGHPSGDIVEAT